MRLSVARACVRVNDPAALAAGECDLGHSAGLLNETLCVKVTLSPFFSSEPLGISINAANL